MYQLKEFELKTPCGGKIHDSSSFLSSEVFNFIEGSPSYFDLINFNINNQKSSNGQKTTTIFSTGFQQGPVIF